MRSRCVTAYYDIKLWFEPSQQAEIEDVLGSTVNQTDCLDVLVIGAGGTGKSTLIKQMAATLQGFSSYDQGSYREIIKDNVYAAVESILRLTEADYATETDMLWNSEDHKHGYPRLKQLCGELRDYWDLPEVRRAVRGAIRPAKVTPEAAG
jgi:energy-coupling factor transporter ATP-binding protein EcfA2